MNFLLLMSDEHNPKFSSVYGHPFIHTPNMDRLAARGTVYENAYCPSPLCLPSRSSFMSGLYVHETQAYNNANVIDHDYLSYGKALSDQGIHSAYTGKADVYTHTDHLGFDEMIAAGNRAKNGDTCIQRQPFQIRPNAAARGDGYGPKPDAFKKDQRILDGAINWITHTAPTLNKPWSFTVNTTSPHFPHDVTQALWDMYPNGGDLPAHGINEDTANHPTSKNHRAHFQTEAFSETQTRGLRRGYLGCVTWTDAALGQLLDALEASGQLEQTVIAYCSDHGEMLGKFGMWWKCSLYDDSVRVPLIIAGPGFAAGQRVKTPVTLLDLQATIFQSVGAKRPANWHGQPLQAVDANDNQRVVFSEYHGHGATASAYMIRKGDWKMLYHLGAPTQLFNMASDPEERQSLAEQEPAKVKELMANLREICDPDLENERCETFIQNQLEACSKPR